MKHRVKQELKGSAARADNEIGLTDGVRKAFPCAAADMLDTYPQAHAERQRD